MNVYKDQIGREVRITERPKRIVSVVPSQTELLFDLGLSEEVVGITKFCVHPNAWFRNKKRIGGTKNLNIEAIRALKPDLIIANKEENQKESIELLAKEFPIWISDIKNLEDALAMINSLGVIVARKEKAQVLSNQIKEAFLELEESTEEKETKSVAYFIWKNPWMLAANDTFINEMIKKCGLRNAFEHIHRYPECNFEDLRKADPDLIFLSSEPYPFKKQDMEALKEVCPKAEIHLVDGEYFSWYGSRLTAAAGYFKNLRTLF